MINQLNALENSSQDQQSKNYSPGKLLREARQVSGLMLSDLSSSLKVSVEKLEALESDDFSKFSDTVFMRALAASMCRALNIDSVFVLSLMPSGTHQLCLSPAHEGIHTRLNYSHEYNEYYSEKKISFSISLVLSVVILLIAAIFIFSLPYKENFYKYIKVISVDINNIYRSIFSSSVENNSLDSTNLFGQDVDAKIEPNDASLVNIQEVKNINNSVIEIKENYSDILFFKVRESSWIQVKDMNGSVVLQRTLIAGESVGFSSSPPLSVVIGRADVTDVYVRGVVFDVASMSRENVARFEVK